MTTSTQQSASQTKFQERRSIPRIPPQSLIYVTFGGANGGMVINASDGGFAISMAIPVGKENLADLRVRMNGLPEAVEAHGRMAWTSKSKKRAGIQLLGVNETQREKIRQWLFLEGVREVNLLPASVAANSDLEKTAVAGAVATNTTASVAQPNNIVVLPDSSTIGSLLDRFGGTPPESLAPEEADATAPTVESTAEPIQTFEPINFDRFDGIGLRDREWDVADITLVPRKRTKPEGLSAVALTVLWIAIPTLAIGIYAERHALVHTLNRGDASAKTVSPRSGVAAHPVPLPISAVIDSAPDKTQETKREDWQSLSVSPAAPDHVGSQSDLQQNTTQKVAVPEFETSTNYLTGQNAAARTDNNGKLVDTGLSNSLSVQEARARVDPASTATKSLPPKASKQTEIARLNSNVSGNPGASNNLPRPSPLAIATSSNVNLANQNTSQPASAANGPSSTTIFPDQAASASSPNRASKPVNAGIPAPGTMSAMSSDSNDQNNSPIIPQGPGAHSSSEPVPPDLNARSTSDSATKNSSIAPNAARNNTTVPNNTTVIPSASPQPVASNSIGVASNSGTPAGTFGKPAAVVSSSNVSLGLPSSSSGVLPDSAFSRSPAGELLVARKNGETFLLNLPAESEINSGATSIRMQRSIMVPPQSRWHGRGPIAEVKLGELISNAGTDNPDRGVPPRAGDVVTVRALVGKDGEVLDLKPVSGRFALMPRVMRAVRGWRYKPTLVDGKPVESEVNVTIKFGLNGPNRRR